MAYTGEKPGMLLTTFQHTGQPLTSKYDLAQSVQSRMRIPALAKRFYKASAHRVRQVTKE